MRANILALLLLTLAALFSAGRADAADWSAARELSMRLKEAGRPGDAYNAAARHAGGSAEDRLDRDFVLGWIALRDLDKPELALRHFKAMAGRAGAVGSGRKAASKAKAGYWLGRTLRALGRKDDADLLFRAALAYPTTFYGQLAGSELKVPMDKAIGPRATSGAYPIKDLYWHDERTRKELVLAVIREESRFRQSATSHKKARGMMQVLDSTAVAVGRQSGVRIDVEMMRRNGDYNIAVGSRYLGGLIDRFGGNPMLAAAAYNAGPGKVDEWLGRFGDPRGSRVDPVDWAESIPYKETREYVQKVMASYITYLAIH